MPWLGLFVGAAVVFTWTTLWLSILASAAILFIAVNVAWRYASRVTRLPCPSALSWMVEGNLVDRWCHTERMVGYLGLKPGMRVLEIGPGPGRVLLPIARQVAPGGEAVGLELQSKMIEKLKDRAGRAGLENIRVVQGDAAAPVDRSLGSFDAVVLVTVLGEIPERQRALRNAYQLLRPGGLLSVTEILGDPHYQRIATVRQLAEEAGFRPREVFTHWMQFTANFERPAES